MITNWDFNAITDEMINTVETTFFSRMKSARGLHVYNIQTSVNSTTVVSIWPDQAAANRAMEVVGNARSKATSTFKQPSNTYNCSMRYLCYYSLVDLLGSISRLVYHTTTAFTNAIFQSVKQFKKGEH